MLFSTFTAKPVTTDSLCCKAADQVVEEHPADAPAFTPVGVEEVAVTLGLEGGVIRNGRVGVAGRLVGAVEVSSVVFVQVVGRQIPSPTGPARLAATEPSDVHVTGGQVRAAGVNHHRDAGRLELSALSGHRGCVSD